MTQKNTLNFALAQFCREYNNKYLDSKISEREFNLLHEFVFYLTPVSDGLIFSKRLMDCAA